MQSLFYRNININILMRFRMNRLGIGNLLEVMHEQELENSDRDENDINDNEDYDKKSDTAEDFSDITELAEDLQVAMQVWH